MNYKQITIQDIVDIVTNNPKVFKDGMNTPVFSGDFEGNYEHHLHEISATKFGNGKAIFLGYEMHEDQGA